MSFTTVRYTHKEQTQKKYPAQQACTIASMLLKERYKIDVLCVNVMRRYSEDEMLTLPALNDLVDELYDDTLFHEGKWFGTN